MLMKEDLHLQLRKMKRRNRKIETRVEESFVAASDRRSQQKASKTSGGKRSKRDDEGEVDTDDDDSELLVSPKSLMLETAEHKSKLEQLEMALQ